jgi:hypothetical protein
MGIQTTENTSAKTYVCELVVVNAAISHSAGTAPVLHVTTKGALSLTLHPSPFALVAFLLQTNRQALTTHLQAFSALIQWVSIFYVTCTR